MPRALRRRKAGTPDLHGCIAIVCALLVSGQVLAESDAVPATDDGFAFNLVLDGGMENFGSTAWTETSDMVDSEVISTVVLFGENARQVAVPGGSLEGIEQVIPSSLLIVGEQYMISAWVFAATVDSINSEPINLRLQFGGEALAETSVEGQWTQLLSYTTYQLSDLSSQDVEGTGGPKIGIVSATEQSLTFLVDGVVVRPVRLVANGDFESIPASLSGNAFVSTTPPPDTSMVSMDEAFKGQYSQKIVTTGQNAFEGLIQLNLDDRGLNPSTNTSVFASAWVFVAQVGSTSFQGPPFETVLVDVRLEVNKLTIAATNVVGGWVQLQGVMSLDPFEPSWIAVRSHLSLATTFFIDEVVLVQESQLVPIIAQGDMDGGDGGFFMDTPDPPLASVLSDELLVAGGFSRKIVTSNDIAGPQGLVQEGLSDRGLFGAEGLMYMVSASIYVDAETPANARVALSLCGKQLDQTEQVQVVEVLSALTDAVHCKPEQAASSSADAISITSMDPNIVFYVDNVSIEPVIDIEPPVLALNGKFLKKYNKVTQGLVFNDPGVSVTDNVDDSLALSMNIVTTGIPDSTMEPGTFQIMYSVQDSSGNAAKPVKRNVEIVADASIPVIFADTSELVFDQGDVFNDMGVSAFDAEVNGNCFPDFPECPTVQINLTDSISRSLSSGDDIELPLVTAGTFTVTYDVVDSVGNAAVPVSRDVKVNDVTAPVIDSIGKELAKYNLVIEGGVFSDPGATAMDETDGDITDSIVTASNLDVSEPGKYVISYTVADKAGNVAVKKRKVTVVKDEVPPTLSLENPTVTAKQLGVLPSPNATASDMAFGCDQLSVCDSPVVVDLTGNISVLAVPDVLEALDTGFADINPDTYIAFYSVQDGAGNEAKVTSTIVIEPFQCDTEELEEISVKCLPLLAEAIFGEQLSPQSDCCVMQNQISSLCTCAEVGQTFNGNATLLFPLFQEACGSEVSTCFEPSSPSPAPVPQPSPTPSPIPAPLVVGEVHLSITQQGSLVNVFFQSTASISAFLIEFTILGDGECPTVYAATGGAAASAGIFVLGVDCTAIGVGQTGSFIPPTSAVGEADTQLLTTLALDLESKDVVCVLKAGSTFETDEGVLELGFVADFPCAVPDMPVP